METQATETTSTETAQTAATTEITEVKTENQNETASPPAKSALLEDFQEDKTESSTETTSEKTTEESLKLEDIKLPEGYEYDSELGQGFLSVLNDEKLSRKELAQKLFDMYHEQGVKLQEGLKVAEAERTKKYQSEIEQEKADWLKQCESDKEYGGQNWEASQAVIDRGCSHLATPEAVKLMQAYNLNYHPEIVRMFYRAGLLAGEDKSQVAGNGNGKERDPAMAIFGDSLKEFHKRRGEI